MGKKVSLSDLMANAAPEVDEQVARYWQVRSDALRQVLSHTLAGNNAEGVPIEMVPFAVTVDTSQPLTELLSDEEVIGYCNPNITSGLFLESLRKPQQGVVMLAREEDLPVFVQHFAPANLRHLLDFVKKHSFVFSDGIKNIIAGAQVVINPEDKAECVPMAHMNGSAIPDLFLQDLKSPLDKEKTRYLLALK